jgi:hypothetical protein
MESHAFSRAGFTPPSFCLHLRNAGVQACTTTFYLAEVNLSKKSLAYFTSQEHLSQGPGSHLFEAQSLKKMVPSLCDPIGA